MRSKLPAKLEEARIRDGHYGSDASYGGYGCFELIGPCGNKLRIMSSAADDSDKAAAGWEHVSVSRHRHPPNWEEMCFVKDLFWEPEECVVQFHPPRSQYVNNHPHCLHLWKPKNVSLPVPPLILVGLPPNPSSSS